MALEPLDTVPARVLAVYAHPDDPEVSCSGALARWHDGGAEIHLVVATAGEKGTFDPAVAPEALAATRAEELAAAAEVVGVDSLTVLGVPDGEVVNDAATRRRLVALVRSVRPEVVVTSDPTAVFFGSTYVNHLDHRRLGEATVDACAPAASMPHYFPDAGPPHQVDALLLTGTLAPDTAVDVSTTIERKLDALRCHHSQLGDDADEILDGIRRRAVATGADAGVGYAEAFRAIWLA